MNDGQRNEPATPGHCRRSSSNAVKIYLPVFRVSVASPTLGVEERLPQEIFGRDIVHQLIGESGASVERKPKGRERPERRQERGTERSSVLCRLHRQPGCSRPRSPVSSPAPRPPRPPGSTAAASLVEALLSPRTARGHPAGRPIRFPQIHEEPGSRGPRWAGSGSSRTFIPVSLSLS